MTSIAIERFIEHEYWFTSVVVARAIRLDNGRSAWRRVRSSPVPVIRAPTLPSVREFVSFVGTDG